MFAKTASSRFRGKRYQSGAGDDSELERIEGGFESFLLHPYMDISILKINIIYLIIHLILLCPPLNVLLMLPY